MLEIGLLSLTEDRLTYRGSITVEPNTINPKRMSAVQ